MRVRDKKFSNSYTNFYYPTITSNIPAVFSCIVIPNKEASLKTRKN